MRSGTAGGPCVPGLTALRLGPVMEQAVPDCRVVPVDCYWTPRHVIIHDERGWRYTSTPSCTLQLLESRIGRWLMPANAQVAVRCHESATRSLAAGCGLSPAPGTPARCASATDLATRLTGQALYTETSRALACAPGARTQHRTTRFRAGQQLRKLGILASGGVPLASGALSTRTQSSS